MKRNFHGRQLPAESTKRTDLVFLPKEEWLAQRRHTRKNKASNAIIDYASPEEVAALRNALTQRFKRVKGSPDDIRHTRSVIRQAIRAIENGRIPSAADHVTEDLLAPIRARYEAARNAAPMPEDESEAWGAEQARRADLQAKCELPSAKADGF